MHNGILFQKTNFDIPTISKYLCYLEFESLFKSVEAGCISHLSGKVLHFMAYSD